MKDIANVIAGYAFRGAINPDSYGNTLVFQAKDLKSDEIFEDTKVLTKISLNAPVYSGHLKKNDVLLTARGMKSGSFRATLFVSQKTNVIASSSVHIIRINDRDVLSEYVVHYLNSKYGQNVLSQIVSGSYIGVVSRSKLENVEIPIPPIWKQEAIINLYRNMKEQQKIQDRKKEINKNIINAVFKNITTK